MKSLAESLIFPNTRQTQIHLKKGEKNKFNKIKRRKPQHLSTTAIENKNRQQYFGGALPKWLQHQIPT
jgi:hypothetical protein